MSPFTAVLGTASGFDCFCDENLNKLEFKEFRMVRVRCPCDSSKIEVFWAKGIVIPKKYPDGDSIKLCKKIESPRLESNATHYVSSGIGIRIDCIIELSHSSAEDNEISNSFINPTFIVRNLSLESVYRNHPLCKIHNPPNFREIPKFFDVSARPGAQNVPGLLAKKKCIIPLLLISVIVLLCIPGLVQAIWSEDGGLGDIINACIGVGSVLVSALLSASHYKFNSTVFLVNLLRGEFLIINDFAARILLSDEVKKLESLACDTRLPKGLISNMNNCAVRSTKNGWLAIGRSIRHEDMINHGYYIIQEEGLVIDLIERRVLVCVETQDNRVVHLVRDTKQLNFFSNVCMNSRDMKHLEDSS